MAVGHVYVYLFAALVAAHLIFADETDSLLSDPGDEVASAEETSAVEEESAQERFLFPLLSVTTCNYTAAPGTYCLSCIQGITCYSSNVATVRTCIGLKRYCNGGVCSFFPGSLCTSG